MEGPGIGSSLRETVLELFFPTRCCFCRRLTGRGVPVCAACARKYPDVPKPQCEQRFPRLRACFSPLRYDGDVRRALLRYKFGGLTAYASVFADFMVKCLDENGISCDSIITWVPLSRKRLRQRGYDQAGLLAEEIAKARGQRCVRLLEKTRHTPAQSGLRRREERQANAAGAYRVIDPAKIAGREILLVDDIVTTGSTLSECARVLREAGAGQVTAVTAARRKD